MQFIKKNTNMGKGDQRTKRGKIVAGTFGKSRPKNKTKASVKTEKVIAK